MDGEREVEDFVTIEEENEGKLMTEHMSMIIGQPTLQISLSLSLAEHISAGNSYSVLNAPIIH